MARSIAGISISFSLWLAMAGTAAGQAAVEYGLGAARAATTAAPAQGVGKAIGGLAGSLDKAVKAGQQRSEATPAKRAPKTPALSANTAATPAPSWEDPSAIRTGLTYGEVVRRFGPPALEITGEAGRSLTYSGTNGTFQLEIQDEKVASIEKPKS
jgi:hypothetical protein